MIDVLQIGLCLSSGLAMLNKVLNNLSINLIYIPVPRFVEVVFSFVVISSKPRICIIFLTSNLSMTRLLDSHAVGIG